MSLVPVAIFFAFCIILFVVFKAFNMEAPVSYTHLPAQPVQPVAPTQPVQPAPAVEEDDNSYFDDILGLLNNRGNN